MKRSFAGVSLLLLAVACERPGFEARTTPTRGVILIVLGNVGAQHLGLDEAATYRGPSLDHLAKRGLLFDNAWAQSPSTLASNASLVTGLYPQQHGASFPSKPIPATVETLAERFSRFGYRTAGHTEGGAVSRGFGFHRGFDLFTETASYDASGVSSPWRRGAEFLRGIAARDRFFLYLHTQTAAAPYAATEGERTKGPETFEPTPSNLRRVANGFLAVEPDAAELFAARHASAVERLERDLGSFVATLEELQLMDDTTIVVTADHGEEFLEHGALGHRQVYPEVLRVPLLILHPAIAAGRVSELVELVDLAPTLYDLARLPPGNASGGATLLPLLAGIRPATTWAYGEARGPGGRHQRTLLRRRDDTTYQLVSTHLAGERDGTWVTRRAALEIKAPPVELSVVSFSRPRSLRVRIDDDDPVKVEIGTTWTPLTISWPPDRDRYRLELTTDDCESPRESNASGDPRCLSFKLRGAEIRLDELFALDEDPRAQRDLASDLPAVATELRARLSLLAWSTLAPASPRPGA